MPSVKPSITGQGMNVTARPRPVTPRPARSPRRAIVTSATLARPCCATIGASTTAIAPVGPDTWTFEPPNTAATRPATTAVISPAAAPTPGADAERQRERECDDADRHASEKVAAPRLPQPRIIAATGEEAAGDQAHGLRRPSHCGSLTVSSAESPFVLRDSGGSDSMSPYCVCCSPSVLVRNLRAVTNRSAIAGSVSR